MVYGSLKGGKVLGTLVSVGRGWGISRANRNLISQSLLSYSGCIGSRILSVGMR